MRFWLPRRTNPLKWRKRRPRNGSFLIAAGVFWQRFTSLTLCDAKTVSNVSFTDNPGQCFNHFHYSTTLFVFFFANCIKLHGHKLKNFCTRHSLLQFEDTTL